jgi:hypothetical protein
LAFVKEVDTKAVLNSGTRFDPVLTSTTESAPKQLQIFPNPATATAVLDLAVDQAVAVELFALNGQRFQTDFDAQGSLVSLNTASLPAGIYLVKITGSQATYTGKFIKQ